jgi:hypothetical protein
MVRRVLTEPKTFLAGATLGPSFAWFRDSMAAFNAERNLSRAFGRWDSFASMVESRGGDGAEQRLWGRSRVLVQTGAHDASYKHSLSRKDISKDFESCATLPGFDQVTRHLRSYLFLQGTALW